MRKLRWCGVLLLLAVPAVAQEEAPKADLFGGYSFASLDGGTGSSRLKLNGWNGSVTGNFNRWFGVTADFSGHYGSRAGWISTPTPFSSARASRTAATSG